ncbi:sugar kinase [Caviibacter abscessus]|uniref:sugar kinase n=1 Tax=Caviibacter abscessus TaxID=1766719 RepID=UPI0008341E18|nr:sugar kinase [Caviibacter abscessus]
MKKVMLIGEPLTLFIANKVGNLEDITEFTRKVAGAELNVAVGLTRLGYNAKYLTNLGEDPCGKSIIKFLKKENIGTDCIKVLDGEKTGVQLKAKTTSGDPEVSYYRTNTAACKISEKDIETVDFKEIDLLHITGIPLAISESFKKAIIYAIKKAKENGVIVTFDPNIRISMWKDKDQMKKTINEIAIMSDYFIPGISECEYLIGEKEIDKISEKYFYMGVKRIIVKDGSKGSYYIDKNSKIFESGFIVDEVVDTVGAGDGFAVGIISSILENLSESDMLIRANAIGAIQVMNESDNEGLPTYDKLQKYIQNTKRRK